MTDILQLCCNFEYPLVVIWFCNSVPYVYAPLCVHCMYASPF